MSTLEGIAATQRTGGPPMSARGRDEKRLLAALRRGGGAGREAEPERARGDRLAAEALVEATWRQVYAALFRLTGGDADLAADLTQDAYRKAWGALGTFDGRARFSTWLYRIAYTTFLNHARRPRRVVALEDGPAGEDDPSGGDRDGGHHDPAPLPDETLAAGRTHHRLRRAVLALPEELRFTVTARYWGGLPVREIARQEGITGAAVRKRLRKATTLLAAHLEDEA
jgi:RNA polymerase sigma-70 factor (ECF subfamily)